MVMGIDWWEEAMNFSRQDANSCDCKSKMQGELQEKQRFRHIVDYFSLFVRRFGSENRARHILESDIRHVFYSPLAVLVCVPG